MIDKVKSRCTGCNSCYNKCPTGAILVKSDLEGFPRPSIDIKLCIECNLCEAVCPVLNPPELKGFASPKIYAAWSRKSSIRINSTSGGIFSELALAVLNKEGVVFGAKYNEDFSVQHAYITTTDNLHILRQSKYTQSFIRNIFREVENFLKQEKLVLFCGTPCQIAGLRMFLLEDYDNLILVDLICRGVTSPYVYKMYLKDLEIEYRAKIKKIQFKNKDIGWNQFCTHIIFSNGMEYLKNRNDDSFMFGYLFTNLYLRPCCYECQYKKIPRIGDISLGDFWGIGDTRPHLDENKGTSLVFANSKKGIDFFAKIGKFFFFEECTFEEALSGNPAILYSAFNPGEKKRNRFFTMIKKNSTFIPIIDKHRSSSIAKRIKKSIVRLYEKHIKR